MIVKLYGYKNCSTCRNAKKYLDTKGIQYTEHPIRETPPTKDELDILYQESHQKMTRLFNTSGLDYRALNMKDTLPTLTKDEAFNLLLNNGNLVKRPVLIVENRGINGFNVDKWNSILQPR